MSYVSVAVGGHIDAPADLVYRIIADYREHHPCILPPAFSNFSVEEGGVGAGTVTRFDLRAGGRTESYHQRVEEPDPGRVLREIDIEGERTTTFIVTPSGAGSTVHIETTWPASGVRGVIERLVAPRLLRPIYEDELARLNEYAVEQASHR